MKTQDDIRKDLGYLDCEDCDKLDDGCAGAPEVCNDFILRKEINMLNNNVKARFCFKVWKLGVDEDDNPCYAYIDASPKDINDNYIYISDLEFKEMQNDMANVLSVQFGILPEEIIPITEEEYKEAMEEE